MLRQTQHYRLAVLDALASGRRSVAWARRRLRRGAPLARLWARRPALLLVIRVRGGEGHRGIFLPLPLLLLTVLAAVALPIAGLILARRRARLFRSLCRGTALLVRMQISGCGPLVQVAGGGGEQVTISLC